MPFLSLNYYFPPSFFWGGGANDTRVKDEIHKIFAALHQTPEHRGLTTSTALHVKAQPHSQRINIKYLFINFEYYTFLSDKADYMNSRKMTLL